jgi:2-polyprenyl-3-methyl-5-hydroxy-6-metoxy-1,4-benzoquinol methylase
MNTVTSKDKSGSKRPYLDFYEQHGISPVVNTFEKEKHFSQRRSLYQTLGIVPLLMEGKTVLEFGPGNGVNSLYTMSLNPKTYTLVDGNDTGLANIKRNFSQHYPESNKYHVVKSTIEGFKSEDQYDLVVCEGVIPNQLDPSSFSRHIASFVKPGGIYILTCHDIISNLSEVLRAFIGSYLVRNVTDFNEKVTRLVSYFSSHFKHLTNMSRTPEDWVVDNILNVEYWKDSSLFSVEEAISAHQHDMDVYGSSPSFCTDWRWYKDMYLDGGKKNEMAMRQYRSLAHNLLDTRLEPSERPQEKNEMLRKACTELKEKIKRYEETKSQDDLFEVYRAIEIVRNYVVEFSPMTSTAIEACLSIIKCQMDGGHVYDDKGEFESWWGRGMQYMSFIKRSV